MSLIAVAAGKGSPGVTTTALALACVWPRPVVLAECDPAGSDLAIRQRDVAGNWLPRDRGLLAYASTLGVQGEADVHAFTQRTQAGVDVLLAPPTSTHSAVLRESWGRLATTLSVTAGADVLCDCGRVTADAPVLPLLSASDLVLFVARATAESVVHTRATLRLVAGELDGGTPGRPDVAVVVVAESDDAAHQVGEALSADGLPDCVVGLVAFDPRGVSALHGPPTRGLDRSALLASVRALATVADEQLAERGIAAAPQTSAQRTAADPVEVGA